MFQRQLLTTSMTKYSIAATANHDHEADRTAAHSRAASTWRNSQTSRPTLTPALRICRAAERHRGVSRDIVN